MIDLRKYRKKEFIVTERKGQTYPREDKKFKPWQREL